MTRAARRGRRQQARPLDTLAAYTNIIAGQDSVLQAEAASMHSDARRVLQGLGLISAVNAQEDLSEQDAVLASALASQLADRPRPGGLQPGRRSAVQTTRMHYEQLLTPAELTSFNATLNKLAPSAVQEQPDRPSRTPSRRTSR